MSDERKIAPKGFVLVVDDAAHNLQVLCNMLGKEKYRIAVARDGKQALDLVEKVLPDLILLDVLMPGIDGFEVCKRLKQSSRTRDIPIVFLTAKTDVEDIVKGFEIGAVDYFTKPFNETELLAIVRTHLELQHARGELKRMQEELKETREKLDLMARTDPLTELTNRRGILERLKYEEVRFERNKKPFSLVLAGVDNLRIINDKYGQSCGDFVLHEAALLMKAQLRKQDSVARWGSKNFLILLPETELEGARITAEKIRHVIIDQPFVYQSNISFPVSITFGVSTYGTICTGEVINCIKSVEMALSEGKEKGKNCVVTAQK
jgi:diguanylate cyclase (GGDEF)-like protein